MAGDRSRARAALIVGVVALVVVTSSCGGSVQDSIRPTRTPAKLTLAERVLQRLAGANVYVGGVAYTTTLIGIDFRRTKGKPPFMRIFVADGFPGGTAEWFQGRATNNKQFSFRSASGHARIKGRILPVEAEGTITLADGSSHVFFTRPAGHGAGIFEVTVDKRGNWRGRSLSGSTLKARQRGSAVTGSIRTPAGVRYPLSHVDLSRVLRYGRPGGQADTYTLVVTRRGTELVGRGGGRALRKGRPSRNIIALDLPDSSRPTRGIYYGRVRFTTDRILFDIDPMSDGRKKVKAYTSDSEPEPKGDVEWFSGVIQGSTFALTSASGNARIGGRISGNHVSGILRLPGGKPARYYTKLAGDGAGVYDVTVDNEKRYTGHSEEGGRLDLKQEGELVMGTITAPGGAVVDLLGADLTLSYRYPQPGSQPDTYVAFASPDGRFLFGRSGDVRAGTAGKRIIGLDKKC